MIQIPVILLALGFAAAIVNPEAPHHTAAEPAQPEKPEVAINELAAPARITATLPETILNAKQAAEILAHPAQYQGQTLPVIGDILSPRDIVATFSRVTGIRAEYRSAYDRDGLLHHFPANELLVQELLGMTSYAVEYGYYRPERDLAWSRRIDPTAFTWEQFLRHSGWRGEAVQFGVAH